MENKSFLLPYYCQKVGWGLATLSLALFICFSIISTLDYGGNIKLPRLLENAIIWITYILPFISLAFLCLSRERKEDEYIEYLRRNSVFIVVVIGFVAAMITYAFMMVGIRFYNIETVGLFIKYAQWFSSPLVLGIIFLLIFKGVLFVNWLKARQNGQ